MVVDRNRAHILIGLHVLNVGLDNRVVVPNRRNFIVFARNDAINRLIRRL